MMVVRSRLQLDSYNVAGTKRGRSGAFYVNITNKAKERRERRGVLKLQFCRYFHQKALFK
jgi:hypothetical protein